MGNDIYQFNEEIPQDILTRNDMVRIHRYYVDKDSSLVTKKLAGLN